MKNEHCDCENDGFCPRYQQEMAGRLRSICRGEQVDAGTAAQYRQLWAAKVKNTPNPEVLTKCPFLGEPVKDAAGENVKQACAPCGGALRQVFACKHPSREPDQVTVADCATCEYRPKVTEKARAIILRNHLSPGDVLVMSAAIHSLHKAHPGKFVTAVETTANQLYEHNPDVVSIERARELGGEMIETHYPAIQQCNERGITFMQAYCEFFSSALGVHVPLLTNRPHVYLSSRERTWMDQTHEVTGRKQRFWIVNAGRKADFTTKHWSTEAYQRVIDALRGRVVFVQVGAADHYHKPLRNVINLVGKTDIRQLVRLTWHADGVLCGVTLMQHLAAALQKPSVVVMGGREPVLWNSYSRQQLLHTVGSLSCCKSGGCWRSRTEKLGDGGEQDNSLCENPIIGEEVTPRCMTLIKPHEVVEKILLNYA